MLQEIGTGKTVEEAIQNACDIVSKNREDVQIEIINMPKKNFFGKLKSLAKVRIVYLNEDLSNDNSSLDDDSNFKIEYVKKYLMNILFHFNYNDIDIKTSFSNSEKTLFVNLESTSENIGSIIGRRGETLDAFQHLISLVYNQYNPNSNIRVILDCAGYRSRREETLVNLATNISNNVIKTGRKSVLEPMNSYERKIIHSVVSNINNVNSKSIGTDPNRKIIIFPIDK